MKYLSREPTKYNKMPATEGGADDSLVAFSGYPYCIKHGAMNKVGATYWRCLVPSCRAGIEEHSPITGESK